MPSKEGEQMLIVETENMSNCSVIDSLIHKQTSLSLPQTHNVSSSHSTSTTRTTTSSSSTSSPSQSNLPPQLPPPPPPPPLPSLPILFKKSSSMPIQTNKIKNYNNCFTEEDFLNGISFEAKYIGSLDVAKPNSRVEIVAAMRRIRYEFKSKGVKKHKVSIVICTDGIHVNLKRPNKMKFLTIKKNLNKSYSFDSHGSNKLLLMSHPIYRVFYVSHDSQDLNIFSYIARDSVTNVFRCNVFKAYKKEQAMLIVRTIGQAFEVCHQINQCKSTEVSDISEQNGTTAKQSEDDDINSSDKHLLVKSSPKFFPKKFLKPQTSIDLNRNNSNIDIEAENECNHNDDEHQNELSSPLMYAEDTRLSFGLRQHFQLLTQQMEQQRNEIDLISAQLRILKEQIKSETEARIEAQSKNLQLLSQNRNLLQNIQGLLKYINELETKLGFDSNLNRELFKILNINAPQKDLDYRYLAPVDYTESHYQMFSKQNCSPQKTNNFKTTTDSLNRSKYIQTSQQQQTHIANLPSLQTNQYFSSDYMLNSTYIRQQQQQQQQQFLKTNENTLFPLSHQLSSYQILNKTNQNNTNSSPDSGVKEMSFDSNISDVFNTTSNSSSNNNNNNNNLELSNLILKNAESAADEYKTTNSINYLYNIKRKLNSFKNLSNNENILPQQQTQQLNDLSKTKDLNKENFLITISKKQLSPLSSHNYSIYMNTPSSTSIKPLTTDTITSNLTTTTTTTTFNNKKNDYHKTKSISNSSIENYSLSEGYDSYKQNDEDITKLNLSQFDSKRYEININNDDSMNNSNDLNNDHDSSDDDNRINESEKIVKYI